MTLKKHHKIMIGSFSSFLIILLVANSIFIYLLYGQLQLSYNQLDSEIGELNTKNQAQFKEITENLLNTKQDVQKLGTQLTSISDDFTQLGAEFSELKSSVSADFSGIVEDAIKSVATISTNTGQGSGFFVNQGYIVTNYHVVEGATAAGVYTYDGETHPVSLIGYNANMDVALLKIESTSYPKLDLADSDDVTQAEKVIAIGNPYGLSFSVSEGIVSAIHREGPNGLSIYIQTTAELNAGNSGGPLIDKNGDVVGMNNFKLNEGEGLGFALESNYIKSTVNDIALQKIGNELI